MSLIVMFMHAHRSIVDQSRSRRGIELQLALSKEAIVQSSRLLV